MKRSGIISQLYLFCVLIWTFFFHACSFHIHYSARSSKIYNSLFTFSPKSRNPIFINYGRVKPNFVAESSTPTAPINDKELSTNILEPPNQIKMLKIPNTDISDDDTNSFPYTLDFTRVDTYENPNSILIRRISNAPHIFLIKNFISKRERETLCYAVNEESMSSSPAFNGNIRKEVAGTVSSVKINEAGQEETYFAAERPNSTVYWISPTPPQPQPNHENQINVEVSHIAQSLMRASASLLLSPSLFEPPIQTLPAISPKQQFSFLGCEDLQMVHYTRNGEFLLHQDGVPRVLTVLFYLNGVAGTWFPLANTSMERGMTTSLSKQLPLNKQQAMEMIKGYIPGEHGVLVSSAGGFLEHEDAFHEKDNIASHDKSRHNVPIEAGDAIAFYNYLDPESLRSFEGVSEWNQEDLDRMYGQLDWRAIHAGLPTISSDKWIATLWFLVKPSKLNLPKSK